MLKLFKYEMKNTCRFFFCLCIAIFLSTFFLIVLMNRAITNLPSTYENITGILSLIFLLLLFGCSLTFFFVTVSSYRRDFYRDHAYLMHTLPLSGSQILGAKFLNTYFWYLTLIAVAINAVLAGFLYIIRLSSWADFRVEDLLSYINEMFIDIWAILGLIVVCLLLIAHWILVLYFSITVTKVLFRNTKAKHVWFIIMLLISSAIDRLHDSFVHLVPYFQTFTGEGIVKITEWAIHDPIVDPFQFPLISFPFYALSIVLLFFGTALLIDNYVDI